MGDWLSNANEALFLKLVRADEDEANLSEEERALYSEFHPTFTYPIFGDKETIYGYSNLKINLFFASGSLAMYLNVSSSAKLPTKTADDIEGTLYKFIPADYNKSFDTFKSVVEKDATAFKPLGKKIHSYTRRAAGKGKGKGKETGPVAEDDPDAVVYEVYHSTWDTPGFREYHRRMQLFILLYIEGGSYIQEDEDKWEFVTLYERRTRPPNDTQSTDPPSYTYHFAGYSSLYPFWCWPDKVRLRLSQFVILPPCQHAGHGSALYGAIYQLALARDDVVELTVEDPSEAFEDLRDRNDLKMLLSLEEFVQQGQGTSGKFGPPVDKQWAEKWRKDLKIASRQFHRLIEMLILRRLDPSSKQAQKAFRLQVKERLYRFNYEILSQLEKDERLEKLEETFQNVRTDYQRILPTVK
ncbi:histone acetyltransferase 1 [Ceratobasidium sp. UAMH 11750]|nr:histone acetyltransferase 1 [Ceratobasidium sp. UAMH 11750]